MQKFENMDILACLDAVMKQNTGFYQSDFEIDKKIIHEAAASPDREDRTLLWLSRPSGTHCFRERDVFLKDTRPYNTWKFHGEQTRDRILGCTRTASVFFNSCLRNQYYRVRLYDGNCFCCFCRCYKGGRCFTNRPIWQTVSSPFCIRRSAVYLCAHNSVISLLYDISKRFYGRKKHGTCKIHANNCI